MIQGFDLMYARVILGYSVSYDKKTKKIWFNESCRAWNNIKGTRTMQEGIVINVTNIIS